MALGSGLAGFVYSTQGLIANILVGAFTSLVMASLVWRLIPDAGEPKNEVVLKESRI